LLGRVILEPLDDASRLEPSPGASRPYVDNATEGNSFRGRRFFFVGQEQPPRIFSIFQKVNGEASARGRCTGSPWRPDLAMPHFRLGNPTPSKSTTSSFPTNESLSSRRISQPVSTDFPGAVFIYSLLSRLA
jgi:hypothetical protein